MYVSFPTIRKRPVKMQDVQGMGYLVVADVFRCHGVDLEDEERVALLHELDAVSVSEFLAILEPKIQTKDSEEIDSFKLCCKVLKRISGCGKLWIWYFVVSKISCKIQTRVSKIIFLVILKNVSSFD